jgi:hypothetical protein
MERELVGHRVVRNHRGWREWLYCTEKGVWDWTRTFAFAHTWWPELRDDAYVKWRFYFKRCTCEDCRVRLVDVYLRVVKKPRG